MKKLLIPLMMALLLPAFAHADASVSSDAGRSIDNGQSSSIKRDKSLSTDKSQGSKSTDSAGHEKSKEKSKSKSHSKKVAKSDESSKSYSVDVNINGLLLREFTSRYERSGGGTGTAGEYFGLCKPLTRAIADYPVVYWDNNQHEHVGGRNEAEQLSGRSFIENFYGAVPNHNNLSVSRYIQCRITASYWVAEAGERAAIQKVSTEAEVRDRIGQVFSEMDADESVFQTLRQRSRDLWAQETCSRWLKKATDFHSPEIQCGVFSFEGNTFTVENRETLSESSINGHSYKIAVSTSASDTVAEDDSVSSDDKVSASERSGDSTERFKESKKTASLNKSKNLDQSNSSKVDRSTGNSMNAAPKD